MLSRDKLQFKELLSGHPYLFGLSNKVLYLKELVIEIGFCFLKLFVSVDAILHKLFDLNFNKELGNCYNTDSY